MLAALAALIPAAALAGFVVAGREAARLAAADPTGRAAIESAAGISAATRVAMDAHAADAKVAFYGLVALTVAILALRLFAVRRPAEFPVVYAGGPTVRSAVGPTLLEISRTNRVPHLSVCGGKARCSTCRVRIVERGEGLAPPAEAEQRLLRRIGAPPDVRLACQIRPNGPLMVALLLKPTAQFLTPSLASGFEAAGVDREAAVLFVDIRGFTRLSQAKLAYDVVHILNSFFAGVGQAIEAAGGRVDKYIGDGLMAVFEHPSGLPGAARAAVEAVVAIDDALGGVNRQLADEIAEPLRLAMGLHGGRLVIGRIGWGAAALPTVIGPAVNIASRLESLAKARNVALAVSRECAIAAGLSLEGLAVDEVDIRGLEALFPVLLVADVAGLRRGKGRRGGVIALEQGHTVIASSAPASGRSPWMKRPVPCHARERGHPERHVAISISAFHRIPQRYPDFTGEVGPCCAASSCPTFPLSRVCQRGFRPMLSNSSGVSIINKMADCFLLAQRSNPGPHRAAPGLLRRFAPRNDDPMPHGLSRQPVRKIHHSRSRQTAMNSAVKPRLTPTPTSPWP